MYIYSQTIAFAGWKWNHVRCSSVGYPGRPLNIESTSEFRWGFTSGDHEGSSHWLCSWLWFLFLYWFQCCCDSHICSFTSLMLNCKFIKSLLSHYFIASVSINLLPTIISCLEQRLLLLQVKNVIKEMVALLQVVLYSSVSNF